MPRPGKKPLHLALTSVNTSLLAKSNPALASQLLQKRFPLPGVDDLQIGRMAPHTAIIGASGTGKTILMKHLMSAILPAPRQDGGLSFRAVIYDPKRELYPFLAGLQIPAQQIVVTHPFDSRSAAWDLAKDFVEPAHIEELAEMIVPEDKKVHAGSGNEFFEACSRIIIQDVIAGLAVACPDNWELRDVIACVSTKETLKAVLMKTRNGRDAWNAYLHPLELDASDKTALSIYASLVTYVRPFQSLAALWHHAERKYSLKEWLNGSGILLLGADPGRERTLQRINQLLIRRICQLLLSRNEERPVDLTWFFIDEVREAGKLRGLRQLLTEGRSKGSRVVMGFQDIEGLYSLYDQHEAEEMVGLCANRCVLHLDTAKTRKWASDFFGEDEVVQPTKGKSHTTAGTPSSSDSIQYGLGLKAKVLPIEFQNLPLGNPVDGIYGWYAIPTYRDKFFLSPRLAQHAVSHGEGSKINAVEERPLEHQEMPPWEEDDYQVLNLKEDQESIGKSHHSQGNSRGFSRKKRKIELGDL